MNKIKKLFKQLLFSFFFWLLYIEFHPKLGFMWIRPNSLNELLFSFNSLKHILLSPFKSIYIWNINLWEINFFIFIVLFYFIFFYSDHRNLITS
jgi:hypothetical protein